MKKDQKPLSFSTPIRKYGVKLLYKISFFIRGSMGLLRVSHGGLKKKYGGIPVTVNVFSNYMDFNYRNCRMFFFALIMPCYGRVI